jgi:hypothetical protein
MTDATKLLLDLLAVIPDGEKVATFFAEDGVVELPYLHTIDRSSIAVKYRHCQISFSKESARSAILRERRRNDLICDENWFWVFGEPFQAACSSWA